MESVIDLQDPFSFSPLGMIISGILLLLMIIAVILLIKLPKEKPKVEKPAHKQIKRPIVVPLDAKTQYMKVVIEIEAELDGGKITVREAYQKMSHCTRGFFERVTGVDVTTFTLEEIHWLGLPQLEYLVMEYYAPEFAENTICDVKTSIERTKQVISQWK